MDKLKQLAAKGKPYAEKIKRLVDGPDQRQKKRIIASVCVGALVLLLAVMPMMAARGENDSGVKASILSGKVESGDVSTTIRGGGTLAEEDAKAIRLPAGVKITEFLVENYSEVKQGDALAAVDKVTVMTAISEVQETLEYLKEAIEDAGNNTESKYITAKAGGKVKAVYAEKGDDVAAVMTEYGALAVLSLDGMMAVEIESDAKLSAGDSVWVGFEDGRDVVGRVESALNGEVVITVEDDGYSIGEKVVITDSEDDKLGEGVLYVHNAWNAVAYSGTVSAVNLRENTTVAAGKNIFSLKEVENSSLFQTLSQQHRDYEKLMTELFVMYQSGTLQAPCDGIVSGVDRESIHLLSDTGSTYGVSLLANAPGADADATFKNYVGQIGMAQGMQWTVLFDITEYTVEDYMNMSGISTDIAAMTQTYSMTAVTVYEAVDGVWQVVTGDVKQGDILLFAGDDNGFVWAIRVVTAIQEEPLPTPTPSPEVSPTPSVQPDMGDTAPEGNLIPDVNQDDTQQRPAGGSVVSGFGEIGSMGSMGNAQENATDLFDLNGTNILFVTPQNTVTLSVALDESDVRKIFPGQQASVTVDVLKSEVYTAIVTEVGTTGTNSGGNSKYTVELTLEREKNMLVGQSASAVFTVGTAENVLIVPVAALTEDGSRTIVYTGKSGDTLTKPVEVTTGVSDGEFVEICSGLTEGTTYYYEYYDTLELSAAVENGRTFGR